MIRRIEDTDRPDLFVLQLEWILCKKATLSQCVN